MYVDNFDYTDHYHNRMRDVKDKNGHDTVVCLYYAYVTGNTVTRKGHDGTGRDRAFHKNNGTPDR